jgi:hypothetical protein
LMERGTAQAECTAARDRGADGAFVVDKSEAFERMAIARLGMNAEAAEGLDRFGKQTFAAGLVDGRFSGFDDGNAEAFLSGSDRGGEARGAASDNENVRTHRHPSE